MSRLVEILPRATSQLYESASWWAENHSVAQAARWLSGIESAIRALADTAPRHPLAPESAAFDFPLHQMNFGVSSKSTHRVLFSFDDARVLVFAVRHLSQSDVSSDDLG
ncbi:type II toxin-antitoxin system RelE/ParE family toxin [Allorhodopirellula solitaria]|uniref:type II toxin-antitoxin system RelE/ParE family toxin n=1 Tax=Allorhodopirellula solitaria TaxID=2527987 RepID=UPI0011B5E9A5